MNLPPAVCGTCGKQTITVWAVNPAIGGALYRPKCFAGIRKTQGGVSFPFLLFAGRPLPQSELWQPPPEANFLSIAEFVECCLGLNSSYPPELLTDDNASLREFIRILYDYIADPTAIPFWLYNINFAEKVLNTSEEPRTAGSLNIRSNIEFWRTRIHRAVIPGAAGVAVKQHVRLEHLKQCLLASELGGPLPPKPPAINEVNWEILEPDGNLWENILKYHSSLISRPPQAFEEARLKLFFDAKPDVVFVGRSKFEGYVVFVFPAADVAFLESGYVGNALYVMKASEWRELSKLSKTELLINRRHGVERVIHRSGWQPAMRRVLRSYNIAPPDSRAPLPKV